MSSVVLTRTIIEHNLVLVNHFFKIFFMFLSLQEQNKMILYV
nr:MAG TPA: hypothetical protein [Caudoviricetes sp.]